MSCRYGPGNGLSLPNTMLASAHAVKSIGGGGFRPCAKPRNTAWSGSARPSMGDGLSFSGAGGLDSSVKIIHHTLKAAPQRPVHDDPDLPRVGHRRKALGQAGDQRVDVLPDGLSGLRRRADDAGARQRQPLLLGQLQREVLVLQPDILAPGRIHRFMVKILVVVR